MSIEHRNTSAIHKFAFVQPTDPGSVGVSKGWIDTSSGPPYILRIRNSSNTGWDQIGNTTINNFLTLEYFDGTLSGAISAIGSDNVVLTIVNPITITSSIVVPSNIQLDIRSIITLNAGVILTINSLLDPGNKRVFNTTAIGSRVKINKGAVSRYNIAWWCGLAPNTDATLAIEQVRLNCVDNSGGTLYIPSGTFTTTGGHILADSTIIEGDVNYVAPDFGGSCLKLVSPTTSYMWKIGEGEGSIRFRHITLNGSGTTNKTAILFEGDYPNSSYDVSLSHITISGFNIGFNHNSLSNSWQLAQVLIEQSIFQSNNIGIKANSLNSSFAIDSTNFAIPASGWAFETNGIGICNIKNSEFAGGGASSKVMKILGAHVQINFIGCQDEGCGVFIQNDASDITGIINLWGNLIQSDLEINETCTINSMGNNFIPHAFKFGVNAVPRITSINDNVRIDTAAMESPGVIPAVPLTLSVDNNSIINIENNTHLGYYAQRYPQKFISSLVFDGNATSPLLGIGHQTIISESKKLVRLGRLDSNQEFDFYYDVWRQNSGDDAGRLKIEGNQSFYAGYDYLNGDIYAEGAIRSKSYALTDAATITIDPRTSNFLFVELTNNRTLNFTTLSVSEQTRADGQVVRVELKQDATGSRTIAMGSNISFGSDITAVTLTTTPNKIDILTFIYSKRLNKWLVIDVKKGY